MAEQLEHVLLLHMSDSQHPSLTTLYNFCSGDLVSCPLLVPGTHVWHRCTCRQNAMKWKIESTWKIEKIKSIYAIILDKSARLKHTKQWPRQKYEWWCGCGWTVGSWNLGLSELAYILWPQNNFPNLNSRKIKGKFLLHLLAVSYEKDPE